MYAVVCLGIDFGYRFCCCLGTDFAVVIVSSVCVLTCVLKRDLNRPMPKQEYYTFTSFRF